MRDLALAAIHEVADVAAHVGPFIGEAASNDVTVVHFASLHPGYPGWQWSVALVRSARGVTVNEVWMEPGEGALAVPAWKPWSERIRPGDLGAGDVVETDPDDGRLRPGYSGEGEFQDMDLTPAQWEIGLGRARVLSTEGLADAAERWRSGEDGPDSAVARMSEHPCSTCAWLMPIGGLLGQAFGVCAHDLSPSDGHVVSMDHGCGAHSDVAVLGAPIPVTDMLIDDTAFIAVDRDISVQDAQDQQDAMPLSELASGESTAATNSMANADKSYQYAGEGDIAPPQDSVSP